MQRPSEIPDFPFTTLQARRWGWRTDDLTAAVKDRRLVRVLTGVYVRSDVPLDAMLRAKAAALVVSSHTVICDRTAAWILGVDAFRFAELDVMPPLDTYVLRGCRATDRPECDGGSRDLQPQDWVFIGGVRVTTPVRTALDLGCKLPRRQAVAAMDALMRVHGFTTADLMRELPRYFRRRGVVQLRQLVPLVDGLAESSGESWTRLEIADHGLPLPVAQHWVNVDGVPTYRLDLAYPRARIAIEYDGEQFHTQPEDRERDRVRREWLRDHGWRVIVVDRFSFSDDAAAAWIGELSSYLRDVAA